ncbi:hypothetical protein [Modestobacter sp. SYSU DS0657]
MRRSSVRDLALEVAFALSLVLVAEVVVRVSSWSRFWVLVVVLTVGWAIRIAVQRRRVRRAATAPEPRSDLTR